MNYIKGNISKIIYQNEDNGYVVGILHVRESDLDLGKTITFTGTLPELNFKTNYKFNGELVTHSKYGNQFNVESFEIVIPDNNSELVTFLSSDLFPIGEKTAKKIVDKFGDNTINTILNNKEELLSIPRLKEDKIDKIYNILLEYQNTSNIVLELTKIGFTMKDSLSLLNKYKTKTLDIINNNIYDVIDNINLFFKEIDNIALKEGYKEDDERRLLSLVIYVMTEITFNNGNTYSSIEEIYKEVIKYVKNIDIETLEYILIKLNKKREVVIKKDKYYIRELYDSEEYIANRLYRLSLREERKLPKLEDKIEELEKKLHIIYDESQKKAIKRALYNNFTIITGGPGTGKTTIINGIVKLLTDTMKIDPLNIALLAPTGRASRKLMEIINIPAYTIHKYLYWDKETNTFEKDEYNPNKEEYVIVDEASMIDTVLFSALLKGTREDAKFIIVGDYYQLPSVREGQVLKDLIDSDMLEVIKLNTLYRQNEDSYIVSLAHEIKNKELSDNFLMKKDDYNFIEVPSDNVMESIESLIIKALEKGYSQNDIQVLAPMYKTKNGIDNLNKMLQNLLNPKSPKKNEIEYNDIIYREGDKVLELVNDPDNNISNGDIGYIESIITNKKGASKEIIVNFDGNLVTFTPKKFVNITLGYAISIHKSQGGEYKMVIIPFVPSFKRMLYNKLVYTGVTRAKSKLILLGERNSFIYGVMNNYDDERKTTLKEMIINKYNS